MNSENKNISLSGALPKEKCFDSTLSLLIEGYLFIPNRIRKYHTNLFQIKLLGQKVYCMSGKEATELFYNQDYFTRKGVMPNRIQETLFGKKGIQTLDGASHVHRKLLFMSMMTPQQIDRIKELTRKQWIMNSERFGKMKNVILLDEATLLFFQVACKWAGVPLKKSETRQKAKDMCAMIDAFGGIGPRHWIGRCARNRSECWADNIIEEVRKGRIIAPKDSALSLIAWHRELNGKLLNSKTAAVELINILRPITAIATYVTFGALALHLYPAHKKNLLKAKEEDLTMFAQEIRRYFPFGPFLAARVRNDFQWQKHYFEKGTLVFLDIYGTNHDPSIWKYPNLFQPKNFKNHPLTPFDFIPQGGGNDKLGTRCPGEQITVELLKESLDFLVNRLEYQVPLQDLTYRLNRIPTFPKSRFIMNEVRKKM